MDESSGQEKLSSTEPVVNLDHEFYPFSQGRYYDGRPGIDGYSSPGIAFQCDDPDVPRIDFNFRTIDPRDDIMPIQDKSYIVDVEGFSQKGQPQVERKFIGKLDSGGAFGPTYGFHQARNLYEASYAPGTRGKLERLRLQLIFADGTSQIGRISEEDLNKGKFDFKFVGVKGSDQDGTPSNEEERRSHEQRAKAIQAKFFLAPGETEIGMAP